MKMHKLTEKKPDMNKEILAYITHSHHHITGELEPLEHPYFYVLRREGDKEKIFIENDDMEVVRTEIHEAYTEAYGEGYATWLDDEIEGWCYPDEIEVEYVKEEDKMDIEFVSYDGGDWAWCNGTLILRINGKEVSFGSNGCDHDRFWSSGGSTSWDPEEITEGPWQIWKDDLPEYLQPYAKEIEELFNENVEWGCCGGCI